MKYKSMNQIKKSGVISYFQINVKKNVRASIVIWINIMICQFSQFGDNFSILFG